MLGMILVLALAQAAAPAGTERPAEPAKAEKPKKVCVEEAQMGSHFKKRICATPEVGEAARAGRRGDEQARGERAGVLGPGLLGPEASARVSAFVVPRGD
jgi:hypothetical protein